MGGGYAWVTLATNDSYSLGALVLAHSLKQVGTQQQLVVLITPGVTSSMRKKLSEIFNIVKEVNILDSQDEANLRLLKRPELGITFTKLHCWRLTEFEKCVFLDADTLVLENCDELFEREELSAAPDIGWPDCFNSGVFVYRPSIDTYENLIQFALEKGSFDGGDQGLLNLYFSDWAHKDISKHLPFIYNMSSTACYSYLPAFKQFGKNAKILHFIGSCKPWLQYFNTETRKVHPSEDLKHLEQILQHWWNIFCNLIHPALSPDMTSHTDTVLGSQSYTSQNISYTSYYHEYENNPTFHNPQIAEDYQNVWDPWEEYDSRQSGNNLSDNIHHDNHNSYEQPHSQSFELEHYIPQNYVDNHSLSSQTYTEHIPSVSHTHVKHREQESYVENKEPESFYIEHKASESPIFECRPPESHDFHSDHRVSEHQPHIENVLSDSHIHLQPNLNFEHEVVESQESKNQNPQNLIESHNTNTFFKADHQAHIHHPSKPTYSQPHSHITHHQPPQSPKNDHSSNDPPSNIPRLPDECVITTTVSKEITLQSDTKEDNVENQAGLAGAFANLTLGQARTPEQEALDDHLRRQGWEVGNIDYLGRDCFDNIWTKICETISQGPDAEPLSATKDKKLEQPVSQKEPTSKSAETVEHPQTPKHTEPVLTDINQPTTNIEDKGVELAKETEPPVAAKVEPFVECIITQPTKSPEQEKKTITKSNIDSSPEISLGSETSIPTTAVSESTGLEVEKSSKETSVTELNLETPQKLSSTETSTDISKSTPEISPPVQLETGKKVESEVFGKQDSAVIQHEDYNPTIGAPLDTPVKSKTSELVASETPHTDPIQTQSLHLETPIQTDDLKLVLDTQKLKSSIQKDNLTVSETPNFKSSIQTESLIEVSETPKIESPIQTEDSKPISESQKPISAEPEIAKTLTAPENPKSTETPTVKTSESLVGTKGVSQLISQETELSNQLPKQASKEVSVPQEVASIPIEKDTSKDVAAAKVTSKDVQAYMTAPISKKTVTSEETTKKSPVAKEIPKEASKEVSKPITKEPKQKETVPLPTSKVTESTPPTTPSAESSIPETPSTAAAQDTVPGPTPPPRKASGAPKKTGGKKK